VLPPNVPAEVLVEVTGMPAATDRYTTPGLVIEPRATFEQSWIDRLVTSPFLMVVLLGLLALWVLVRTQTRTPE
jgi:hypothetical protein